MTDNVKVINERLYSLIGDHVDMSLHRRFSPDMHRIYHDKYGNYFVPVKDEVGLYLSNDSEARFNIVETNDKGDVKKSVFPYPWDLDKLAPILEALDASVYKESESNDKPN